MESADPLIAPPPNDARRTVKDAYVGELSKVCRIALPMVIVSLSQYLLRTVAMMMLGHLGELALSSSSIATSLCNVTGFSFILGMSCALETLCGQAYGAEQYQKVGIYTYGSIIWLFIACMPVCGLWVYTEKLLVLIGQDPEISKEAGIFAIWLIPSLFPFAILQSMVRYLQVQSLIMPMVWCSLVTLLIHLPLSWLLIFPLNLGNAGAAFAIGLSHWLNVIMVGIYIKFSPSCKRTHAPLSKDVLLTFQEFFRFAIPSALMICLEWWTSEIIILLGGLLAHPELETSVLSICLTITVMHFHIPNSFGAAGSTRISNELGAGKPEAAKLVLYSVLILITVEYIVVVSIIAACHSILGYIFSNDKEVVQYVQDILPLVCISIAADSLQSVLCGIARGSGWQHIGAFVNLAAYYVAGIPVAILLGFVLHLNGKGLWGGLVVGATFQALLLTLVAFRADYHKQAMDARNRIFKGRISRHVDEVI